MLYEQRNAKDEPKDETGHPGQQPENRGASFFDMLVRAVEEGRPVNLQVGAQGNNLAGDREPPTFAEFLRQLRRGGAIPFDHHPMHQLPMEPSTAATQQEQTQTKEPPAKKDGEKNKTKQKPPKRKTKRVVAVLAIGLALTGVYIGYNQIQKQLGIDSEAGIDSTGEQVNEIDLSTYNPEKLDLLTLVDVKEIVSRIGYTATTSTGEQVLWWGAGVSYGNPDNQATISCTPGSLVQSNEGEELSVDVQGLECSLDGVTINGVSYYEDEGNQINDTSEAELNSKLNDPSILATASDGASFGAGNDIAYQNPDLIKEALQKKLEESINNQFGTEYKLTVEAVEIAQTNLDAANAKLAPSGLYLDNLPEAGSENPQVSLVTTDGYTKKIESIDLAIVNQGASDE